MPVVTRWWWVRHAPVPDDGRIYGQRDLSCDCGDAAVFAALAAALPADAIWVTSHLRRTTETARAIHAADPMKFGGLEPAALPELAEQHLGDWQGRDRKAFYADRKVGMPSGSLRPTSARPAGKASRTLWAGWHPPSSA
jgi:alpha-ribazole phosphatase